jgi:triosephosphate isomerase (TIM)
MFLIIANWKMNPLRLVEAKKLFDSIKKGTRNIKKVKVVVCPPFIYLPALKANGAQDCFWQDPPTNGGAFTGQISPIMLKNIGCQYVIIGHSEKRKYQKEDDQIINKKLKLSLKAGLKPILCIANLSQLEKGIKGIFEKIIVAYEPVSAIGTGKPYSPEKARKMRVLITRAIANRGKEESSLSSPIQATAKNKEESSLSSPIQATAKNKEESSLSSPIQATAKNKEESSLSSPSKKLNKNIPIIYGGSVNSQNAESYIKKAGFQGLLIGGASLKAKEFLKIVKKVSQLSKEPKAEEAKS